QLSPPGKGLVDREVIRLVTPGTVVEPDLLESDRNNYLASVLVEGDEAGLAYVDITTSEFATAQMPLERLGCELQRVRPSELLVPEGRDISSYPVGTVTMLEGYRFALDEAEPTLRRQFGVESLEGFGCAHLPLAVRAAGALVQYVGETQKRALSQLTGLSTYSTEQYMVLDGQTMRNLELFQGGRWGEKGNSLLSIIDTTRTPMGRRLLRNWVGRPLLDVNGIQQRQDEVEWFYRNGAERQRMRSALADIGDLERLLNRVKNGQVVPRELVTLRDSLEKVPVVIDLIDRTSCMAEVVGEVRGCSDVVALIRQAIIDEPAEMGHGDVVRTGFSAELDELRGSVREAKHYMATVEQKERQRTGIRSLRVGYNKVFGYYIEVTRANLNLVPDDYIRKQTLTEAERYFTPELKHYESIVLDAQARIAELESQLLRQVCGQVAEAGEQILATARVVARLDVLATLAEVAERHHYVRPAVNEGDQIDIVGGRHPMVERAVGSDAFVPNDTQLANNESQLVVLTGPNMSGKSTYLRQVALIVLLAQTGSFVPAESATIGVVDRIFTRIGAQEDLAAGQSTFMVEMTETANILHNASARSLVILDEIGRGTSTYDGLSIAWAVAEFIHNHPGLGAKTLFATHYHELVELAATLPRVRNFNVAVAEDRGQVVFLHKIVPGGADRSYGIHVAQLAGLPRAVVHRAQEVLEEMERRHNSRGAQGRESGQQLALFSKDSLLANEVRQMDVDSMSPLQAITKLYELKRLVNS
ncbi:MAG: DNA mismatch repair protein MutS, partial [Chloroflexota bacterium]